LEPASLTIPKKKNVLKSPSRSRLKQKFLREGLNGLSKKLKRKKKKEITKGN